MKYKIYMKKYIPWILIVIGLVIIVFALFQKFTTDYYQNKIVRDYSEYINELKIQELSEIEWKSKNNDVHIEDVEGYEVVNLPETQEDSSELTKLIDGNEISGIIEIPKINVVAAILEGTDDSALKYTVGHYPNTAQPGEIGNCVLLGHRNYLYGHFFRNLDKLEEGDKVFIQKDIETYTYEITESFEVNPEDVWVLNQTEDAQITMITCTPIGVYNKRLVVKGILIMYD